MAASRGAASNLPANSSPAPPAHDLRDSPPLGRAPRSPPGSVIRRSNRYSPYQRGSPEPSSSRISLASPAVTRRVMFSPQQGSQTSADSPIPPSPVASTRHSSAAQAVRSPTAARSPRTPRTPITPTRSSLTLRTPRVPRTPGSSRRSRPSPLKTGRPRDLIWKHYTIERENGKKHGRCIYCGTLKKNGKPSGNLLNHLVKPNMCPSVPRDVQTIKMLLIWH
jgi:hypothetical protein